MPAWLLAVGILCAGLPSQSVFVEAIARNDAVQIEGQAQLTVVVFLGVECPLAKLYAGRLAELAAQFGPQGVQFLGFDPNAQDSPAEIKRFQETHALGFSLRSDARGEIARLFGATRTPEVFVFDRDGQLCYQGRIDDQYTISGRKPTP